MKNKDFYSTMELAQILGISRIAVFQKIQEGKIKASRVGRNFIIPKKELRSILGENLTTADKKEIDKAVKKTVEEYGETLRLLGAE